MHSVPYTVHATVVIQISKLLLSYQNKLVTPNLSYVDHPQNLKTQLAAYLDPPIVLGSETICAL